MPAGFIRYNLSV